MIASSIMEQYKLKQQEIRFFRMLGERLKMEEKYSIAANDRAIAGQIQIAKEQYKNRQDYTKWEHGWKQEIGSFFNSEELMKKVEKKSASDDGEDNLWVNNWKRTSGKLQRGENLDDADEGFIETLNAIARANINGMRFEKQRYDEDSQRKDDELKARLMQYDATRTQNTLLQESRQIAIDERKKEISHAEAGALIDNTENRFKEAKKIQLALSQKVVGITGRSSKDIAKARSAYANIKKAEDILTLLKSEQAKDEPLDEQKLSVLRKLSEATMEDVESGKILESMSPGRDMFTEADELISGTPRKDEMRFVEEKDEAGNVIGGMLYQFNGEKWVEVGADTKKYAEEVIK